MSALRDFIADHSFTDARTLLQTGNVVFRGEARSAGDLEQLLETEAKARLGLDTDFFVRPAKDWKALVSRNPFPDEARRDPSHLVVMFLKNAPDAKSLAKMQDEARQVLLLRDSLHRLEQKMTETKARAELLIAQHRRARLAARTGLIKESEFEQDAVLERLRWKITESEALGQAKLAASAEPATEAKLAELEREERVNRLLEDLKAKASSSAGLMIRPRSN